MATKRTAEAREWHTPKEILDGLDYTFDIDVASPGEDNTLVQARRYFTASEDGLVQPWTGTVFLHPPTGRKAQQWLEKFVAHGDGIALTFARTDTPWFQMLTENAGVICLVSSRVKFHKGSIENEPVAPSAGFALFAMGHKAEQVLLTSGLGVCLSKQDPPAWRDIEEEDEPTLAEDLDAEEANPEED